MRTRTQPREGVRHQSGTGVEGNTPEWLLAMSRASRVSEHHFTTIFVKWRPSRKSNNRSVANRNSPIRYNSRHLVCLGEVEGGFHASLLVRRPARETNARSSRRGREKMRSQTLEFGTEVKTKWSDLITRKNPCNKARETFRS